MFTSVEEFSMLALYSAMFIYALAFIFHAVDLANRSGQVKPVEQVPASKQPVKRERGSRALRIGFSLTILAFVFHLAATVGRGVSAGRVPWSNMYEFALTATLAIVFIYLIVNIWADLRFLGVLVTGLVLLFLGVARVNYYVAVVPLPPALDSYWLVLHIIVAVLATGFFTLSFGLSVVQLLQSRRQRRLAENLPSKTAFLGTLPSADRLENLAYRLAIVGFVFWTFTLIAGSIWAEHAWGRYWGWDPKETAALVTWLVYGAFLHARVVRDWRGTKASWLLVIGFLTILFAYFGNHFFGGLHSYA